LLPSSECTKDYSPHLRSKGMNKYFKNLQLMDLGTLLAMVCAEQIGRPQSPNS
jgi:hypothetical protein